MTAFDEGLLQLFGRGRDEDDDPMLQVDSYDGSEGVRIAIYGGDDENVPWVRLSPHEARVVAAALIGAADLIDEESTA